MAGSNLVIRAGVGAWAAVKYIITRGLDIGTYVPPEPDPVATPWRKMLDASDVRTMTDRADKRAMLDGAGVRRGRDGAQ